MLDSALEFLIDVFFGLFTYTLLLRFVMQVLRAPFRNPAGQAVIALTDWIVKPLRRDFPGLQGRRLGIARRHLPVPVAGLVAYYSAFGKGFSLLGVPARVFLLAAAAIDARQGRAVAR